MPRFSTRNEKWREVKDTDGKYIISTFGRLKRRKKYRIKKKRNKRNLKSSTVFKYKLCSSHVLRRDVYVYINQKRRSLRVLMADTFMYKRPRPRIMHKDGDRTNCSLKNLYYEGEHKRKPYMPPPNTVLKWYKTERIKQMGLIGRTEFKWPKTVGKTKDIYDIGNNLLAIVSTDRISAFDKVIGGIQGKGQLLNELSVFWFSQIEGYMPTHFVANPCQNVMIVEKAKEVIPVEFIPRGFATGSYHKKMMGKYDYNEKLPRTVMTYTTKSQVKDEWIYGEEILEREFLTLEQLNKIDDMVIKLYNYGSIIASQSKLILADTKFEFGFVNNEIMLIDEILTPDSSRFWDKQTKESFDKDILRVYLSSNPDCKKLSDIIKTSIMKGYSTVYERIMNRNFSIEPILMEEMEEAINAYAKN